MKLRHYAIVVSLVALALGSTAVAEVTWTFQNTHTSTRNRQLNFETIQMVSGTTGYALAREVLNGVYAGSQLWATFDGRSWAKIYEFRPSRPSLEPQHFFFIDSKTGWLVGDGGRIVGTRNGGRRWLAQKSPVKHDLRRVFFLNGDVGWACGEDGTILRTHTGGRKWNRLKSGFEGNSGRVISDIAFVDRRIGYAVGYCAYKVPCDRKEILLKTSDGGTSWHEMAPKTRFEGKYDSGFSRLHVSRRSSWLIAYGTGGKIYLSTNRGFSWRVPRLTSPGSGAAQGFGSNLNDMSFTDERNGRLVTEQGTIYITRDGGLNWAPEYSYEIGGQPPMPLNWLRGIRTISMADSTFGVAAGSYGKMFVFRKGSGR